MNYDGIRPEFDVEINSHRKIIVKNGLLREGVIKRTLPDDLLFYNRYWKKVFAEKMPKNVEV
jgi:hypothetical protein